MADRPRYAPKGMTWIEVASDPGRWVLVDIEAVESPETYVNPRKGDPDYPDPDWSTAVPTPPLPSPKEGGQERA